MTPIEKLNKLTLTEGAKKYDEYMEKANRLYKEAMELKGLLNKAKSIEKEAVEEYNKLSESEKLIVDLIIETLILEVKSAIGGKK